MRHAIGCAFGSGCAYPEVAFLAVLLLGGLFCAKARDGAALAAHLFN
jgi:hypothetical protein